MGSGWYASSTPNAQILVRGRKICRSTSKFDPMDQWNSGSILGTPGLSHLCLRNVALVELWVHHLPQTPNGGLRNVIDDQTSYLDTASTALMTSVTYRMATIHNTTNFTIAAGKALQLIQDSVDDQGWLGNATDPYTFYEPLPAGRPSPEGQAFVLLLQAAWQAFVQAWFAMKPLECQLSRVFILSGIEM